MILYQSSKATLQLFKDATSTFQIVISK